MKKHFNLLLSLFTCACISFVAKSQQHEPCGVRPYYAKQIEHSYSHQLGMDRAEMAAQKWLKSNQGQLKRAEGSVVVPVVFHVVYQEDSAHQNLPKSVLLQQLEILNRDYNRHNKDTVLTRAVFDSIAAPSGVVFQLAQTDPDGNPTDGVTRTITTATSFDLIPFGGGAVALDNIKSEDTGGYDPWDQDRYLNIWVGRLTVLGTEGLYGIATFPTDMPEDEGGDPAADPLLQGIIVHYPTVGFQIIEDDSLRNGRTMVHEVGHYLGLRHIWADEQDFLGNPGPCDADDYVYDTPMSNQPSNFSCDHAQNNCSNENEFSDDYWGALDPPDMIENFMDYSDELCQNMFTYGQFERMHSFLNTSRKTLWEDGGEPSDFKAWLYTDNMTTTCPNNCDGKIWVNHENTSGVVTYTLDGVAVSGPEITGVCQGYHTVTVSDEEGNTTTLETYVSGSYLFPAYTSTAVDVTCESCTDGSASVEVIGGTEPISIEWQTSPVVTGNSIDNLGKGTYYYTVTDGCDAVYQDSVVIAAPTGIFDIAQESVSIYPNPVKDKLTLAFDKTVDLQKLQVSNTVGKVIWEENNLQASKTFDISTSPFIPGVYNIIGYDSQGAILRQRFVKQ